MGLIVILVGVNSGLESIMVLMTEGSARLDSNVMWLLDRQYCNAFSIFGLWIIDFLSVSCYFYFPRIHSRFIHHWPCLHKVYRSKHHSVKFNLPPWSLGNKFQAKSIMCFRLQCPNHPNCYLFIILFTSPIHLLTSAHHLCPPFS